MLIKIITVLSIILLLFFHNLPNCPNAFLAKLRNDTASQELLLQGLAVERQIIAWYRFHSATFPPATEDGTLSATTLQQMGLDPSLADKLSYSCNNTARTFDLQISLSESTWHSPLSGKVIKQ